MIFITGCARSGTSLTTKILKELGCNLGIGRINTLYENVEVRENVLKPYLRFLGADPMGQDPLPQEPLLPQHDLGDQVRFALGEPEEPWAYKDAKLTLVWREWSRHFPEAKWVLVRRERSKIVDSCMRTSFMRAFTSRSGWEGWVDAHEERFEAMQHLDLIEVWPQAIVDDPEAFCPVATFCGLTFDRDKVEAAIERSAWH